MVMTMREKIENRLKITCEDVDLTTLINIEFYVRQARFFGCYSPTVISSTEMVVIIPFEDAKKLHSGKVELQFAFTDANGNPDASDSVVCEVGNLLKEVGYDPV
jgi:hypothetical protein